MEEKLLENITEQIKKRRTFAIISHPDAGKTTLTEKFLLYGGAINLAGTVKGRKAAKHAVSDWMEIEKERGISVTSSVLQFNYDGYCLNLRTRCKRKAADQEQQRRQGVLSLSRQRRMGSFTDCCYLQRMVSPLYFE